MLTLLAIVIPVSIAITALLTGMANLTMHQPRRHSVKPRHASQHRDYSVGR